MAVPWCWSLLSLVAAPWCWSLLLSLVLVVVAAPWCWLLLSLVAAPWCWSLLLLLVSSCLTQWSASVASSHHISLPVAAAAAAVAFKHTVNVPTAETNTVKYCNNTHTLVKVITGVYRVLTVCTWCL